MEQEKIKLNKGQDLNIVLSLSNKSGSDLGREYSDYTSFIEKESKDVINPVIDNEVLRVRYLNQDTRFVIYFYDNDYDIYNQNYTSLGFSLNELLNGGAVLRNSFYILDFYDSFDTFNREKIFSSYYTQITSLGSTRPRRRGQQETDPDGVVISQTNQLNYITPPLWSLESNITIMYMTLTFFNAKTGKLIPFFNNDFFDDMSGTFTTPTSERMCFKVYINKNDRVWYIKNTTETEHIAKQLVLSETSSFLNKMNMSIDKVNIKKLDTPENFNFDYRDRTYK